MLNKSRKNKKSVVLSEYLMSTCGIASAFYIDRSH